MQDFEKFERTQSFAQKKLLWNRTLFSRHCLALWVQRPTTRSPRQFGRWNVGRRFCVSQRCGNVVLWRRRAWDLWLSLRCFIPRVQVICLQHLPIRTACGCYYHQPVTDLGFDLLPGQPGSRFAMVGR